MRAKSARVTLDNNILYKYLAAQRYLIFWLNNGLVGVALFVFGLFSIFVKASFNCKLAFPILYAAIFQANFEPWLAASLNPYTICFFSILTLLLVGEFALNESEANKHKDPIQ